jgi:diguanylate cyclase (GGDEF)-like protein
LELAGVLLIVSILLVIALVLLTLAAIRRRGSAAQLEAALADASGAKDRADILLAITQAVNSTLSLEEVLNVALTRSGRVIGAVAGAMYMKRQAAGELYRESSYNLATRARGAVRQLGEEPVGAAIQAARPSVVELDEKSAPGLEVGGHPSHALIVPVRDRSGAVIGAMELYLNAFRELTEEQSSLLDGVGSQTAIAIRHAQLFEAQEENALTDGLTRLDNRRALAQRFLQEMQRARRHHNAIAFLMIDLDHFKQVNDTYGHPAGDAVLHHLAQILKTSARESDVCARYGGEEFALILHETNGSGARTLAERIRMTVEAATFPGALKLTVSVGVAATADPALFTQLMDRADQALYAAKQGGRNRVEVADMTAPAPPPRYPTNPPQPAADEPSPEAEPV